MGKIIDRLDKKIVLLILSVLCCFMMYRISSISEGWQGYKEYSYTQSRWYVESTADSKGVHKCQISYRPINTKDNCDAVANMDPKRAQRVTSDPPGQTQKSRCVVRPKGGGFLVGDKVVVNPKNGSDKYLLTGSCSSEQYNEKKCQVFTVMSVRSATESLCGWNKDFTKFVCKDKEKPTVTLELGIEVPKGTVENPGRTHIIRFDNNGQVQNCGWGCNYSVFGNKYMTEPRFANKTFDLGGKGSGWGGDTNPLITKWDDRGFFKSTGRPLCGRGKCAGYMVYSTEVAHAVNPSELSTHVLVSLPAESKDPFMCAHFREKSDPGSGIQKPKTEPNVGPPKDVLP